MIENLVNEEWKDIEGFEGLYQVSNIGRVKTLNYNHTKKEKLMKQQNDKYGYLRICLFKEGKKYILQVHRLVAKAFIPNPDNLPCVNHKSEVKTENCVENLEWCTVQYNNEYSKAKKVLQFDLNGNFIAEFPSLSEVERQLGFKKGLIMNCCNGGCFSKIRNKWKNCTQSKGYIWKWA